MGTPRAPTARPHPPGDTVLETSFIARFLLLTFVVALMAIVGGVMVRFLAQWAPEGLQAVVGA